MRRKYLITDKHRLIQIARGRINIKKSKIYLWLSVFICGLIFYGLIFYNFNTEKVSAENKQNEIENALFTRQEFFGAEAIVPIPTAQARENLTKLAETEGDNPELIQKLAELDEKLEKFDLAEQELAHLAEIEPKKLEDLAGFYRRRGWFEKEAATLRKMLAAFPDNEKPQILARLIESARFHDLKQYLQPEFFQQIAESNAGIYPIYEDLIKRLTDQHDYTEALRFIRQAKANFPDQRDILLEKEVSLLSDNLNQPKEAENAYRQAFDLFWPDDESEKFYGFLSSHERLRVYGTELRAIFKKNPANFQAAMRLAHYEEYNSGSAAVIIRQLEAAKKEWSTDELVTVTRLLLQAGEGELASHFLYTLHVKNELKPNSELRAKILYQLFKMFCEADYKKLSLTRGDLQFYRDVAKADVNPGITTGLLSLLFSDSNPGQKLNENEITATKLFNQAAAYRVFSAYKQEFPTSPEVAQMYLDIVTIYTDAKNTEVAGKTLAEFEQRYEKATDYPRVALKLADAYVETKQPEKEREIYQKVMDYLGKNGNPTAPENSGTKIQTKPDNSSSQNGDEYSPDDYYPRQRIHFTEYLEGNAEPVTYADVLSRLVNSLAKEKKTDKILELYSNEIQKYPAVEWLYEQRLSWLEQTNLVEDQLRVYREALDRFQTRSWQDKLARWFVRQKRQDEFAAYSTELVGKLNDGETQSYLSQFIDSKSSASDFDGQLYLKLYQTAHQRFPHNIRFVNGLLVFYKSHDQSENWRNLSAEYYFESKDVREGFLNDLAKKRELRDFLDKAIEKRGDENLIYELFSADASVRLSNYEEAVEAYRHLNRLYPNSAEFSDRLVAFTRSLGEKNHELLTESADLAHRNAEFLPSSADYRTKSGEIYAELGNYSKSREEWEKLIPTAAGLSETYLDTATVYWDYYQYDDALRTIKALREKTKDSSVYAFETGAILEAQHKPAEAINEYVKALGKDENESHNAKKRLRVLSENEAVFKQINQAVENQLKERKDADWLALAYADFGENLQRTATDHSQSLKESIKTITANALTREISRSKDSELLDAAKDFYSYTENKKGRQTILKRRAEITESPRELISYRLNLADSLFESGEKNQAGTIIAELVQKFPTNYGILTDSSDFYWRIGSSEKSLAVLQGGFLRAKGEYRNDLAFRLAKRFISLNRLDSAEKLLTDLHTDNPTSRSLFDELADVYVREGKPELLRQAFTETVSALRKTDTDPRELQGQIADLREGMIGAFTKLKDYNSAIEQHIEIINHDPDDEKNTENAINYVKRYGGAENLLAYYQKTAGEAFKNYRWNVVLARIYEARKDWENAVKNYQTAIDDQPEMVELYVSLANVETARKNYNEAIKTIDKVLELTNDQAQYVRLKIDLLKKAGRIGEIEAEKAKLPVEEKPKVTADQFAEARKLQATEKDKAVELYRQGFNELLGNPLKEDFKAADITGYIQGVRDVEPLNQINENIWQLRDALVAEAEKIDSKDAGRARNRLTILDGAATQSLGDSLRNLATDNELAVIYQDFNKRIDDVSKKTDSTGTLDFLQNVSHRASLGNLEEKILKIKLEKATAETSKASLQNLIDFYNERGAYQKVLELLEEKDTSNLTGIAETARLVGESEKELEALRKIYQTSKDKIEEIPNSFVARYLEILYAGNREELQSLTEKSSIYQLQLINFLLGKGEKGLVHKAIESAKLSTSWKVARNAETSLALKEFDQDSECYFCDALQISSIGDFIKHSPDASRHLIGDDWFRLSKSYGQWLYGNPKNNTVKPSNYLSAMIENLPKDAGEQFKLGSFYLEKKDAKKALEHFRLALELKPGDENALANLGAAYYLLGDKQKAEDVWKQVIEGRNAARYRIYLETLQKYGLAQEAQYTLLPVVAKNLKEKDTPEYIKELIPILARSFSTEAAKTIYFQKILEQAKEDVLLSEMLINQSLVADNEKGAFYEILVNRTKKSEDSDYEFTALVSRVLIPQDIEEVYTQENNYKIPAPDNEQIKWQEKYLEYLLSHGQNTRARALIVDIKTELKDHYARPEWLILAELRLDARDNKLSLSDAGRFVGIEIKADVAKINPPSVERFNSVLQLLKDDKHNTEANQIFEAFFARMLAFEQYDPANFIGLARLYFQNSEPEKGVKMLQLMVNVSDSEKREAALAELDSMEIIKANEVDKTKSAENDSSTPAASTGECLKLAAEIPAEFGQITTAIDFRRQLLALDADDTVNKLELARLLIKNNNKAEASEILSSISKDQNAARNSRWQAIWILRSVGENVEIRHTDFDSYSQFYNGLIAKEANQNEAAMRFFIDSQIAGKDIAGDALKELIVSYTQNDKPLAALKAAELDKTAKSDELLKLLSETAEKAGEFSKAIEFEKAKSTGGDEERIRHLQETAENAKNKRATDFTVDLQNTRKS